MCVCVCVWVGGGGESNSTVLILMIARFRFDFHYHYSQIFQAYKEPHQWQRRVGQGAFALLCSPSKFVSCTKLSSPPPPKIVTIFLSLIKILGYLLTINGIKNNLAPPRNIPLHYNPPFPSQFSLSPPLSLIG